MRVLILNSGECTIEIFLDTSPIPLGLISSFCGNIFFSFLCFAGAQRSTKHWNWCPSHCVQVQLFCYGFSSNFLKKLAAACGFINAMLYHSFFFFLVSGVKWIEVTNDNMSLRDNQHISQHFLQVSRWG